MRFLFGNWGQKLKEKKVNRDLVIRMIVAYIKSHEEHGLVEPIEAAFGALEILEGMGLIDAERFEESA